MKPIFAISIIWVLISGPAAADELMKLSLDDASVLGTTIQSDSVVKTEGKNSIRITTKHPTTICIGEVIGLAVENSKLIYSAKVKSELDGSAFLEMWAHVGSGQYFSKGMDDPIKGKSDWKIIKAPFIFQNGQKPEKVTLNLVVNGTGTVWIDEVVLSKAPLK